MKLWKKQVNLHDFTSLCSRLTLSSFKPPSLPWFDVILLSSVLASHLLASLLTLLSPVVPLCSSSTKRIINSKSGFGNFYLTAGVQDEKSGQNSSVKWGTEVTRASKRPQVLRNSHRSQSCGRATRTSPQASQTPRPARHHGTWQQSGSPSLAPGFNRENVLPAGLVTTLRSERRRSRCQDRDEKAGQRKRKFL